MSSFWPIVTGTPFYVWPLLAYTLFVGIRNTKARAVSLLSLFALPLVLLGLKYQVILSQDGITFLIMLALASTASFFLHDTRSVTILKNLRSLRVPGNYTTLPLLIAFFCMKYYCGYLRAVAPDLALTYSFIENAASGLFSGYFLGRAARYAYKYLTARD